MIFPTLAVVVGTLLALGDAATISEKVKAVRSKALGEKSFVDAFKAADSKLRKAAVSPETTYLSAGFISLSYYMDSTCSTAYISEGYAVNTCFVEDGASYKYQLTGNSCNGAVREDYTDLACTTLDSTTDLSGDAGCQSTGGYSMKPTCTSGSSPSLSYAASITNYYRDTTCDAVTSFFAFASNFCIEETSTFSSNYGCSGNAATLYMYNSPDCTGTPTLDTVPTGVCATDDDDDNSGYYSPGAKSDAQDITCSSGAASLVNSLGAKAVLALVLGAAAFLSM